MDDDARHSPELIAAIYRTRHSAYAECAVAILNDQPAGLVQRGTGTLVRVATHSFLITASHVVVPGEGDVEPLQLFVVGQSGAPVRLIGDALVSHRAGGGDDDPADVAVIELADETVDELCSCVFLRQTDIVADDDFAEDYYFFTGFPTVWAQINREPESGLTLLTYCTQPYEGATSALGLYRSDWHLLLRRGGGLHISGERAKMPSSLHGISGCSVWRSYFVSGDNAGQARVVAVQTGTYRDGKIVKATRWSLVVKMIVDSYPELRPALLLALRRRRA